VEVALGQGSPRRGNSSKGGDSVLQSLEGGKGREWEKGEGKGKGEKEGVRKKGRKKGRLRNTPTL
jgi:hypothetical protein